MVRVVGRERRAAPAGLEQLVPVNRGQASTDLELAAGVEDLDPEDVLRQLERPGVTPVQYGCARYATPPCSSIQPAVSSRSAYSAPSAREIGVRADAEAEHVAVTRGREDAVQLDAREHEQARPTRRRSLPVVGDREDVEAGAAVVRRERVGSSSPSDPVVCAWSAQRSHSPSIVNGSVDGAIPVKTLHRT